MGGKTEGWWLTRGELALGIFVTLSTAWYALTDLLPPPGCIGCAWTGNWPLPVPPELSIVTVGLLGMVAGLAWMVRILRGPRDEPPPWRYRDR